MMVVNAASISRSLTPAGSVWPTGELASIWISKCRPLFFSRIADGVSAIQRVVQRAPASVRGVEGEAGVHHRYDQLWTGHASDFVVDVLRRCLEIGRFWQQITDVLQKGFVGHGVMGLACSGLVP